MVNTEEFAARLEKLIDYYELSAAAFADKIEVGRSSISHILSGRNKPSLDFVMKVISHFPDVELYWLLNGKGKFPKEKSGVPPQPENQLKPVPPFSEKEIKSPDNFQRNIPVPQSATGKKINKIVIFYSDGSFEAFEN